MAARTVDIEMEPRTPLLNNGTVDIEMEPRTPLLNNVSAGTDMEERELTYHIPGLDLGNGENMKEAVKEKPIPKFVDMEFDPNCTFGANDSRKIDYVLAYEPDQLNGDLLNDQVGESYSDSDDDDTENQGSGCMCFSSGNKAMSKKLGLSEKRAERRKFFEGTLESMGLVLKRCDIAGNLGSTKFVLVHAPFAVLEKQAKIMSIKLPVKESDVDYPKRKLMPGAIDRFLSRFRCFEFPEEIQDSLEEPDYISSLYSSDKRNQFVSMVNGRHDLIFPFADRVRMVSDLLSRARYSKSSSKHFGIERLLGNGTYSAAYPLHQELRYSPEAGTKPRTQREVLYNYWASWWTLLKYQPLDSIKRYFGSKIGFYFAWLGYYTRSLYLAAFIGILSLIYGLINISEDVVSNDICGSDGIGSSAVVCPQCERYCDFQNLSNSCVYAKMTYMFDNGATMFFAALMSIWATLFLEGWKRYHAEIAWRWGLLDFVVDEDTVRPQFQLNVGTKRYDPVTKKEEPYLTGKKIAVNYLASVSTVLFFVCLVLAVVFGMVVYRVIMMRLLASYDSPAVDSLAFIIVSVTAAMINLIIIIIMNLFYNRLALRLTRWECPRTQADFDNSYTFKVFLFQFVNYYSSLFYVAFFKGLFSQLPGTRDDDGNLKVAGYRLEGCDPAGCFVELVIQMTIIMCGKQFFSAGIEYAYPMVMGWMRRAQFRVPAVVETREQRKERIREEKLKSTKEANMEMTRWEADYYLSPTYDQFLFDEYLEMVLQFGFVTLFVAAFPLAPLFAVLNNIIEMRGDARKFLLTTQRPMPAQARTIGVWQNILEVISKMSVTINALVIAFTSDLVPRLMYRTANGGSLIGYVDSSLSYFDTSNFDMSKSQFTNLTECRFRGYRRMPCSLLSGEIVHEGEECDDMHGFSYEWWKVFAARLLFVVVFEHVVYFIKTVVEYLIPDVPTRVFVQQQREKYLLREALKNDISGNLSPRTEIQTIASEDRQDNAFQPGSFDSEMIRRPSVESSDTFITCRTLGSSQQTIGETDQ